MRKSPQCMLWGFLTLEKIYNLKNRAQRTRKIFAQLAACEKIALL